MPAPKAGSVYVFRMKGGLRGACRLVRVPRADDSEHHKRLLVCATTWFGDAKSVAGVLASREVKRMLRSSGPVLYWVPDKVPDSLELMGTVVVKDDAKRKCNTFAPWGIFANVAYDHWRSVNEPAKLERDRKQAARDGEGVLAREVAALKKRERIDLDGVVPLPKPKPERTPEEVLRGFIAAMNRWEKECARIDRENKPALAVNMNGDALGAIFDEFCTPKERKYGRSGSYAKPPEYDPKRERVIAVRTPRSRRMVIETTRTRFGERREYVLLKQRGAWLLDSVREDGRSSIL